MPEFRDRNGLVSHVRPEAHAYLSEIERREDARYFRESVACGFAPFPEVTVTPPYGFCMERSPAHPSDGLPCGINATHRVSAKLHGDDGRPIAEWDVCAQHSKAYGPRDGDGTVTVRKLPDAC